VHETDATIPLLPLLLNMSQDGNTTVRKSLTPAAPSEPVRALLHRVISSQIDIPSITLLEGSDQLIGRGDRRNGVSLDDPCASRRHARIRWNAHEDSFFLEDTGSANGTFVNASAIQTHVLENQDVIRIGDSLFVYDSEPVQQTVESRALKLAQSSIPILLIGETGTGKEVLTRFIHEHSGRAGPLVPVNCGALPRDIAASELFGHTRGAFSGAAQARAGLFTAASGGTLFLDEIGDLPLELQPTLLRTLEGQTVRPVGSDREFEVDTRIVAATNVNLLGAIAAGRFRADLYARLAQAVLPLSPLRLRRAEIPRLIRSLAEAAGRSITTTPDAMEALLLPQYIFNIRELKAIVAEFLSLTNNKETLDLAYLIDVRPNIAAPLAGRVHPTEDTSNRSEAGERERLAKLLDGHRGNISAIAKQLGKPRAQVYRWLTRFGLSPHDHRRGPST
jgi:transcriptional regulator with GAF, ATPase, and Fis domain